MKYEDFVRRFSECGAAAASLEEFVQQLKAADDVEACRLLHTIRDHQTEVCRTIFRHNPELVEKCVREGNPWWVITVTPIHLLILHATADHMVAAIERCDTQLAIALSTVVDIATTLPKSLEFLHPYNTSLGQANIAGVPMHAQLCYCVRLLIELGAEPSSNIEEVWDPEISAILEEHKQEWAMRGRTVKRAQHDEE